MGGARRDMARLNECEHRRGMREGKVLIIKRYKGNKLSSAKECSSVRCVCCESEGTKGVRYNWTLAPTLLLIQQCEGRWLKIIWKNDDHDRVEFVGDGG